MSEFKEAAEFVKGLSEEGKRECLDALESLNKAYLKEIKKLMALAAFVAVNICVMLAVLGWALYAEAPC